VVVEETAYVVETKDHFESNQFGDVYSTKPIATIYNYSDLSLRIVGEKGVVCYIGSNDQCVTESWDLIKTEIEFLKEGRVVRSIPTPAVHHNDLVFNNI